MITKLSQIVEEAQKKGRKRLAVAYGQDSHTLSAVYDAYNEGLVEPTLYGDKQVIEEVCGAEGIDCSIFKIVDEKSDVNCVRLAVAAVVADADATAKTVRPRPKASRPPTRTPRRAPKRPLPRRVFSEIRAGLFSLFLSFFP